MSPSRRRVAVASASWAARAGDEAAAAARGLAGALSRLAEVDVLVPAPRGARGADGAFDTVGVGEPAPGSRWPRPGPADGPGAYHLGVVDDGDAEALELAASVLPGAPLVALGAAGAGAPRAAPPRLLAVDLPPGDTEGSHVGLYVRTHPGAPARPHELLAAYPGYLLVLGDRPGAGPGPDGPSDRVRWLLTRFSRRHVVVVERATATVWRSRACLRAFGVHTRMDLWHLVAHASATVDLAPGPLLARECVESLLYGVPVVAASPSPVDAFAARGGALAFCDTASLLSGVEALDDPDVHRRLAGAGGALARSWYGDAAGFLRRVAAALPELGGAPPGGSAVSAP